MEKAAVRELASEEQERVFEVSRALKVAVERIPGDSIFGFAKKDFLWMHENPEGHDHAWKMLVVVLKYFQPLQDREKVPIHLSILLSLCGAFAALGFPAELIWAVICHFHKTESEAAFKATCEETLMQTRSMEKLKEYLKSWMTQVPNDTKKEYGN